MSCWFAGQPAGQTLTMHSEIDNSAILAQLERLLASTLFRNSKRYPDFLRYVVEKTLHGQADILKERTLGIEVFHRKPDYDSNADPVVRVAAGEVRKRLAQYYAQDGHHDELRIDLPAGSYIPEFRLPVPDSGAGSVASGSLLDASHAAAMDAAPAAQRDKLSLGRTAILVAIVLFLVLGAAWVGFRKPQTALQNFWSPILRSQTPILLCVGSAAILQPSNSDPSLAAHPLASDPITFSDAVTLTRLAGFLEAHRKSFVMQSARMTNFSDLQRTPSILIAGFDNPWTIRLTDPLRFHFVQRVGQVAGIEDREHPQNQAWSVNFQTPYTQILQDYGILARFHDRLTDQEVVVAAGIGENGTVAASTLALNESYLEQLLHGLHKDPAHPNLEVVFSTAVIDGHPGPPHVVAVTQW